MKALLKNIKGIKQEILICDIQPYELPTLRYLIEQTENLQIGSKLKLSRWSDSKDYIVTRFDSKIEIKPIGLYK